MADDQSQIDERIARSRETREAAAAAREQSRRIQQAVQSRRQCALAKERCWEDPAGPAIMPARKSLWPSLMLMMHSRA